MVRFQSGGEGAAAEPERWELAEGLHSGAQEEEEEEQQEPCLDPDVEAEREKEKAKAGGSAQEPGGSLGCPSCCCCPRGGFSWRVPPGIKKKRSCPGLGLFYTLLSAFLFSVASLFLKKIEDLHSVEVSAFRCIFQMMFVLPGLIYYKTGFLGPKDKRMFLFFRGLLGSGAMILLYYAFQVMPLADATVITFSSPVFTSLFAWIFLKEKYSLWDLLFTIFTITGVVLIARPPFLFGSKVSGIEGSYTDHIKGTIAAVTSAVAAASTFVILRKVGKSVHYFLSIWYYAVIGLIVCVIALSVIGEWSLPNCGIDRFLLIAIGLLGLGGQIFLTKALQIEEAGPVAIMKTMDVVFAFILQILFLNHLPTWWTVGGALCVVASSSGTVIRKWRQNSKKSTRNEI
ncbi:solute carrier family 35 member G1 isoform X2 [Sceloporus undulatus]|uniref:solute carrier family 35 member G1 isoform X2 n=1 Tax=Sceloporus undulatus TaxID=8520 RepID=UPI001C4D6354|nr:solute carrier family 35 member G1 isoform X2 [Sceloporus undulatus]